MNGKNHLVTGAVLAVDGALALRASPSFRPVLELLSPASHYGTEPAGWAMLAFCGALYFFGTVLPDIDNGGMVTRWLHFSLPLAHRGWTHSIWAMGLIFVLGYWFWPAVYIGLGMLAHDLMDSPSTAGWCPFYPLGRYRIYNGTVMKRGWTPGLYSSSRPGSETVFAAVIAGASVLGWLFLGYLYFCNV